MGEGEGEGGGTGGSGGDGGGTGGGAGGGGGGGERTVPYHRFQSVVAERNELKTKLAAAEREAQGSSERAATADTLAKRVKELEGELKTKSTQWDEERGLFRAGITDPEAVEVARLLHGKLPEKDRPTLADWLTGLSKEPDKAPLALKPYLPPPPKDDKGDDKSGKGSGEGGPSSSSGGGKTGGLPSTRGGVKPGGQQADGDTPTPEKIREVKERARQTGDWSEWRKLRGHKDPSDKGSDAR